MLLFVLLLATVLLVSFVTFVAQRSGAETYSAITFSDFVDTFGFNRSPADETNTEEGAETTQEGDVLGISDTSIGTFPPVTYPAYAVSPFAVASAQAAEAADDQDGSGFGGADFDVQASGTFAPTGSATFGSQTTTNTDGSGLLDEAPVADSTPVAAGLTNPANDETLSAAIVVPIIDRMSPIPAQAGFALDLFGSGFSARNRVHFSGNGITVEMNAMSGVPSWATVNLPYELPLGTYTVTVTNRTATSAPFTVTVVPR